VKLLTHLQAVNEQVVVPESSRRWGVIHKTAYTLAPDESNERNTEASKDSPVYCVPHSCECHAQAP
jgi:hypothetical protein